MQLWTYQPSVLRVDALDLKIDPTRGQYWHSEEPGFRYREVLPLLQQRVGTDQFLWCYSIRGKFIRASENHDAVEWELNVPQPQILRLLRSPVWEDLVWGRSDDWRRLFVTRRAKGSPAIHALVRVPLPAGSARSHGPPPAQYSNAQLDYARKVMEDSRNLPAAERDVYGLRTHGLV